MRKFSQKVLIENIGFAVFISLLTPIVLFGFLALVLIVPYSFNFLGCSFAISFLFKMLVTDLFTQSLVVSLFLVIFIPLFISSLVSSYQEVPKVKKIRVGVRYRILRARYKLRLKRGEVNFFLARYICFGIV